MNLFDAIHNAAMIDTNDSQDGQMSTAIAEIQDILGQDDGGIAGVHFSGVEDEWVKMTYEERIEVLKNYISSELSFFDGHIEFQEQSEGK